MHRITWVMTLALAVCIAGAIAARDEVKLKYPATKRGDQVDDYHGTKVPDPYRWLEEDVRKSKEVADWVADENKVTEAYFKDIPERETIRGRLTELWNYEKYSAPMKEG